MRKRVLVALLLLLACSSVQAEMSFDGNWLLRALKLPGDDNEHVFATGYVTGAWHAIEASKDSTGAISTPDAVTVGQVEDVVKSYLERKPAERHLHAVLLIFRALKEAWPEKGKKP